MKTSSFKNIFLLYLISILIYSCDFGPTEKLESMDSVNAKIEDASINKTIDTLLQIKDHCFLLENIIPSGENQYRRLIRFNNNNQCSYNIIEASTIKSTKMGPDEIMDGRNSGEWKIINDTVYIKWDAFYTYTGYDRENYGKQYKVKRVLQGKYLIFVSNNILSLKFISEKVISIDPDVEDIESAYRLFYNSDIEGLSYRSVNCDNVESVYMVRNFTPQKKQESNKFLDDYNKKHSCDNQRSFDAGYDLARDQIGNGLLADADYLYRLASNEYNYYCFKKGVEQYIRDKKEY